MRLARNNARDANEPQIVAALEGVGASVIRLDKPVDLLVGYRGRNLLLEVKTPLGPKGGRSHSKATPEQRDFFARWRGQFSVVRTVEEALAAIGVSTRLIRGSGQKLQRNEPPPGSRYEPALSQPAADGPPEEGGGRSRRTRRADTGAARARLLPGHGEDSAG